MQYLEHIMRLIFTLRDSLVGLSMSQGPHRPTFPTAELKAGRSLETQEGTLGMSPSFQQHVGTGLSDCSVNACDLYKGLCRTPGAVNIRAECFGVSHAVMCTLFLFLGDNFFS